MRTAEETASGPPVVMISGAKGGVGKSTVTRLLACELARQGWDVGLLDADVTTPSQSVLFELTSPPVVHDGRMQPATKDGVKVFTAGSFGAADTPFVWHGWALRGFLLQSVRDVDWGPLDLLLVDMPAGTGEPHVAVLDLLHVDVALLVTTPHLVARADLNRLVGMLARLEVPVMGVIENAASLSGCPRCGYTDVAVPDHAVAGDTGDPAVLGRLPWAALLASRRAGSGPARVDDHTTSVVSGTVAALADRLCAQLGLAASPGDASAFARHGQAGS